MLYLTGLIFVERGGGVGRAAFEVWSPAGGTEISLGLEEGEEDDDLGDVLWDDSESFGELLVVVQLLKVSGACMTETASSFAVRRTWSGMLVLSARS